MKFCLDRWEGTVAVCLCEDEGDRVYDFRADGIPALRALSEGDLFEATLSTRGVPENIRPLPEETAARRDDMQRRLRALFGRGKKTGK